MPARFHSHTYLHPLCRQITVEFLRFLAVLQSPLLQFPSLGIYKSNLLKARVVICTYNQHIGSFSPEPFLVGLRHQSLLGSRSRHCHGINITRWPWRSAEVRSVGDCFAWQRRSSRLGVRGKLQACKSCAF